MWCVNPRILCRNHLLGEHLEMHMFAGCILKGKSIKGYIEKGLLEVHKIKTRHDELVSEMLKRGFNHKSPMPKISLWREGFVDINKNLKELSKRCNKCKRTS